MARCLIIGCGCRGCALGATLRSSGMTVRGTTRTESGLAAIEAAGAEAHVGDPDRVATLASALDQVTIACLLLGSATGPPQQVRELHDARLAMLLSRMLDTPIRGILYEASGSVDDEVLAGGGRLVARFCRDSVIPFELLRADPTDHREWVREAAAGVQRLLSGPGGV
jgi:3-hydroxyisobutyrate dehydrogenase-like beta-hydroxyacid dehydrogenase